MTGASADGNFGATSTASDVVAGIDLHGRAALVTGASSGIGVETVRALASAGARVTMVVRDPSAGHRVADDIRSQMPSAQLAVATVDLADLSAVRSFTESWSGPLHLLLANAGVMDHPYLTTPEGREWHFAVNHLGHFALATGLHRALASAGGPRIVTVSSSGHAASGIRFDDPDFRTTPYDSGLAYGQSKTANVLFGIEANRIWEDDGIVAAAVMPGGIWTGLQRRWDPAVLADMKRRYASSVKTVEQGAATSVYVATRAQIGLGEAAYWEDCGPAEVVDHIRDGLHGVVRHAVDPEAARRLWEMSVRMLA